MRSEILRPRDLNDNANLVLLDDSPRTRRLPVAQTGPDRRARLPDAQDGSCQRVPAPLKDGANELVLKFESPEVGGVKLVKTWTPATRRLRHRRPA